MRRMGEPLSLDDDPSFVRMSLRNEFGEVLRPLPSSEGNKSELDLLLRTTYGSLFRHPTNVLLLLDLAIRSYYREIVFGNMTMI